MSLYFPWLSYLHGVFFFVCLFVWVSLNFILSSHGWSCWQVLSLNTCCIFFFFLLILAMWWFSANSEEQVGLWVWIYLLWNLAYYGGSFFGSWVFTVWELEWVNFADYQVWCDVLACKFQRLYPNVKAARSESTCPTAEFFFALEKKKHRKHFGCYQIFLLISSRLKYKFMDLSLQLHSIASALWSIKNISRCRSGCSNWILIINA